MFLFSLASLTLVALWLPCVLRCCSDVATSQQQHIAATDHIMRTGRATSYSITLQRQIASCFIYWRVFVKIFVSATGFCNRNKAHKFCLIWFSVTCCGDKIMLQRRRFSQNSSSRHEAILSTVWCKFRARFFLYRLFSRLLSPLITYPTLFLLISRFSRF